MHAQGDGAVRAGLDAIAAARQANGFLDNRHTIAHLCLIDPGDWPRFRQLGVMANMTPLWSLGDAWQTVFAARLFGSERSARLLPTRTLLDHGAMLVWGSDWDVTSVSPWEGLETAVTHRYPGGHDLTGGLDVSWHPQARLNLEQAITAYTSAAAYLLKDASRRGSLEVGRLADFIVLDRNLFEVPALEIHQTQVDLTVLEGRIIYQRNAPSALQ